MIVLEFQTSVVGHRLDILSDRLPANAPTVKVIVLCEDHGEGAESADILSLARAARASFPKVDIVALRREFDAMRGEWDERER